MVGSEERMRKTSCTFEFREARIDIANDKQDFELMEAFINKKSAM